MATKKKDQSSSQKPSEKEGGQEPQEGQSQNQEAASESPPSQPTNEGGEQEGAQGYFSDPDLAGRSPEEVERLYKVMKSANREQNRMLNELYSKVPSSPSAPSSPSKPAAEEFDKDDFWRDPTTVISKLISRQLEESIKPFKQNLAANASVSAEEAVRREFDDYDDYKPLIDNILRNYQGQGPLTEAQYKGAYMMAVGMAARNPELAPASTPAPSYQPQRNRGGQEEDGSQPAPPQHRASSHPLPQPGQGGKKRRQLNESEKKLAEEWGMSYEEYLEQQESEGAMQL